ncbi:MAG: hypothetical protein DBY14_05045 [Escherichia coli]|nr:MAG: hypothetical protein DBY14_05045 [Escherichia coli]
MKYVMIIGVTVGVVGAIGSIIYIRSIYNNILTAMPLWMIIGLILFICLGGSNHCVFNCMFCIKKIYIKRNMQDINVNYNGGNLLSYRKMRM